METNEIDDCVQRGDFTENIVVIRDECKKRIAELRLPKYITTIRETHDVLWLENTLKQCDKRICDNDDDRKARFEQLKADSVHCERKWWM